MPEDDKLLKAFITLGKGRAVGLTQENELVVIDRDSRSHINLGPFSTAHAEELGEILYRLSNHTTRNMS